MSTRRRARSQEAEEHENHERWMVTYADMVTLLMVLFIVLFSMSQVDQRKYEELRQGLMDQFGTGATLMDGGSGLLAGDSLGESLHEPGAGDDEPEDLGASVQAAFAAPVRSTEEDREQPDPGSGTGDLDRGALETVRQRIQQALDAQGLGHTVDFRYDERGLVITIVTDEVLFDPGRADLQPAGRAVLDAVGPTLAPLPNGIAVDGHTDDVPISTAPFPSNWELSTARATTVLRYLLDRHGLAASRASASGYADQRPLVPNDTASNRQVNRRVEVVVLSVTA